MPDMPTSGPQIERGHEMPFTQQFSIFLPNRVGRLNELLEVLDSAQVELAGISVVDSTDWAVTRMIFTDPDKAREILTRSRLAFTVNDVLAVVLAEPDTFSRMCKTLVSAEINLHFAYPLLIRRDDCPVLAIHLDDQLLGTQLLVKHGFTLLDHEDL